MAWNPWAELRRREHIVFRLTTVAAIGGGAAYYRRGDRAAIVIDPALHRRDRNAALAHELVHDEFGGGREPRVEKEVARRLVPHDDLVALIVRHDSMGEPVSALEVSEHFDVPAAVAERALRLLKEAWCNDSSPPS